MQQTAALFDALLSRQQIEAPRRRFGMRPYTPETSGRVVGAGPVTPAAGHRRSDDQVGWDGAVRSVSLPSMLPMGPLPQHVGYLTAGISTVQLRQTPPLSAALAHVVVADDATVAERLGSLGRNRRGQFPRLRASLTRPVAAPAAAWVRLYLLTPCQARTPARFTHTTARMAPPVTPTPTGCRRMRQGAIVDRRRLQVMPLVMRTRWPTDRLAQTVRPANAEVLTVLPHQRPGAPGAGLWGMSCPTSAVPHQGWQWSSKRCDPSAICGQGSLLRAYTVPIPVGRAVHDLRDALGDDLLHDDESIAGRGARTPAMVLHRDRQPLRRTDAAWGCVSPARNAHAWRRTPSTLTLAPPPHAPAPDHANVRRIASDRVVAAALRPHGVLQAPTGYTNRCGAIIAVPDRLTASPPNNAAPHALHTGLEWSSFDAN